MSKSKFKSLKPNHSNLPIATHPMMFNRLMTSNVSVQQVPPDSLRPCHYRALGPWQWGAWEVEDGPSGVRCHLAVTPGWFFRSFWWPLCPSWTCNSFVPPDCKLHLFISEVSSQGCSKHYPKKMDQHRVQNALAYHSTFPGVPGCRLPPGGVEPRLGPRGAARRLCGAAEQLGGGAEAATPGSWVADLCLQRCGCCSFFLNGLFRMDKDHEGTAETKRKGEVTAKDMWHTVWHCIIARETKKHRTWRHWKKQIRYCNTLKLREIIAQNQKIPRSIIHHASHSQRPCPTSRCFHRWLVVANQLAPIWRGASIGGSIAETAGSKKASNGRSIQT